MAKKAGAKQTTRKAGTEAPAPPSAEYYIGKIQGIEVQVGPRYNLAQQVAAIASPADFLARVQDLQTRLAEVRRQPEITPAQAQTIEVVEGEFKEVIAEVQKPQPLAARISGKLIAAKSVLDSVGGTIKSLAALGAAIPMLIEAGKKLFGG